MKNLKNVGIALSNAEQKTINGGIATVDCIDQYEFCDDAHSTHDGFVQCMESCSC